MQLDARFKHSIDTIKVTYATLKKFMQRITLISLHLHLKDGSTKICMMSINVSISIDDAIRSLQHAKVSNHTLSKVSSQLTSNKHPINEHQMIRRTPRTLPHIYTRQR